jgi:hypothetical protein
MGIWQTVCVVWVVASHGCERLLLNYQLYPVAALPLLLLTLLLLLLFQCLLCGHHPGSLG